MLFYLTYYNLLDFEGCMNQVFTMDYIVCVLTLQDLSEGYDQCHDKMYIMKKNPLHSIAQNWVKKVFWSIA